MSKFLGVKEGDIFTFEVLPEWADYDNIYFYVESIHYDKEFDADMVETRMYVSNENKHVVPDERFKMKFTHADMLEYKPKIITDVSVIARLMLEGLA